MAHQPGSDHAQQSESAKEMVSSLFVEWYGPMVRYACRAIGSLEAAEDIVQASFTELYRAILEGKAIANPRGWTLCVVRREIVDRLREKQRHGGPFLSLASAERIAAGTPDPAEYGWEDADLTRLLSVLSTREEEVLLLRVKALKYRQIASELKISINSVKTLLSRGFARCSRLRTTT